MGMTPAQTQARPTSLPHVYATLIPKKQVRQVGSKMGSANLLAFTHKNALPILDPTCQVRSRTSQLHSARDIARPLSVKRVGSRKLSD